MYNMYIHTLIIWMKCIIYRNSKCHKISIGFEVQLAWNLQTISGDNARNRLFCQLLPMILGRSLSEISSQIQSSLSSLGSVGTPF